MTTGVIIQARMGSKRLYGKVLKPLGGVPVIDRIISSCRNIKKAQKVICAIPDTKENDILANHILKLGTPIYRGSEDDVLDRYYEAAKYFDLKIIVRVTGDCPLINAPMCDHVIQLLHDSKADYASNVYPRAIPRGWDCEAFWFNTLKNAARNASRDYDREHVTPFIQRNNKTACLKRFNNDETDCTLDTEEDYERLQRYFAKGVLAR